MKKISTTFILILLIVVMLSLGACDTTDEPYTNSRISNIIYSKEAGIAEIKELLHVDSIYFFDCDFSDMSDITIVDSSYNISVWGQFIYDKELGRKVVDLSKQASVEIVANYKIESESTCFGFSVVSEVMRTGMKHFKNDVLEYETENEIYTANTYKSFADLHGETHNGTIYENNAPILHISVLRDFYPQNLSMAINPVSYFRNYTAELFDISVLDTPIYVVTHYENYNAYDADTDFAIMKKISSFMAQNAIYKKA